MLRLANSLRYWKSGESSMLCADALAADEACGRFALADGVSRAPFADLWADALVQQFCSAPLLSTDAWECRWWLTAAAQRFGAALPGPAPRRPGAATFVAARVCAADEHAVRLQLLAAGDACALWQVSPHAPLQSFPLTSPGQFSSEAAALLSDEAGRRSAAALLQHCELTLPVDALLVLASDSLAAYLLQQPQPSLAVLAAAETADQWPALVTAWRHAEPPLLDDDTSALVLSVDAATYDTDQLDLRACPAFRLRTAAAAEAHQAGEWRRLAALAGDGAALAACGFTLSAADLQHARAIATAYDRVRDALNRRLAAPSADAFWTDQLRRDCADLADDPSARTLLASLAQMTDPAPLRTRPLAAAPTSPLPREEGML